MSSVENRTSVLIVGSTGAFGAKIAKLLATDPGVDLVLAGRTASTLAEQAKELSRDCGRQVRFAVLDASRAAAHDIERLGAAIVINASGPFQRSSYDLALAAIAARCHYIDIADDRRYVIDVQILDAEARRAGVLAVSGASSVPGLSSAVVTQHRDAFSELTEIDIAISPGNSFDPGVATVRSVLGGIGQTIRMLDEGAWKAVYGWQGLRRGDFGEAGRRWLGYVDVPDLELLPAHIASLRSVRFQAGLEVSMFHIGLWAASWLVRSGLVGSLEPLAPGLLALKRKLHRLGSDRGGMFVTLSGRGHNGKTKRLTWLLVAGSGHGPYVPALASVALARRLLSGAETLRGARPFHAVVPLADILAEAHGLDITTHVKEEPLPP